MKIIKRSGTETVFDITKITAAITKANKEIPTSDRLSLQQIQEISDNVEQMCLEMRRSPSVEEIQDMVENQIMNKRAFALARKYITYRYTRALVRKSNSSRKIPTRIQRSTVFRGITWQERSARISPSVFCYRRISFMHMNRESFIFMTLIILHSICTTAVL